MRFSLSFSVFALGFGLFSLSNARAVSETRSVSPTSLENCPTDRLSVVNKQVFTGTHGQSLTATSYACGDILSATEPFERRELGLPLELAARQNQNSQICNQTCVQSCHVFGTPANAPNCTTLINTFSSLDSQTFLAPPNTITLFEVGQCSTRFFHNQAQAVNVCFSWLNGLLPTMNECFATPPQNAAECNQANVNFAFDLTLVFPGALN